MSLILLAAVELGGSFGVGSATVHSIDGDSMTVELSVEVTVSTQAVVAHLTSDGAQTQVISLLDRGGGVFGITTELERRDYIVTFEIIGPESVLSASKSLTALGADLSLPGETSDDTSSSDELDPETRQLGWLALALGAASLSALAFWALGGSEKGKPEEGSTEEE